MSGCQRIALALLSLGVTLAHAGRRIALALLSLGVTLAHADETGDFASRQALETSGDKAFFRIELPDSVYDGVTRADLGDLRVFNADGAAVPYAFMPRPAPVATATPRRALALFPLTVDTTAANAGDVTINVRRDPTGTTVDVLARDGTPRSGSRVVAYLIDTGDDAPPLTALIVGLPDTGAVNARVRLDASDDLDRWRTIVAAAPLLSVEYNGRRLTRDRIEFAPLRARYLRLTWMTGAAPPLTEVEGDVGDRIVERPRRVRTVPGTIDGADAFVFDLGALLTVDRLTLELPEVNTVAPVAWSARQTAQAPWHSIGSSVVYRLRQDAGEIVSADFATPPLIVRYLRAGIDPRAGVGAKPPTLTARWYPHELVFAARGAAPFELAYGSGTMPPSALPITTLVPGYVAGKALPANVGDARLAATPSAVNRQALRAPLDIKRFVLWGSLVAAALLLGYMALRLARQMRTGDSERSRDAML